MQQTEMSVGHLVAESHRTAVQHGWWDGARSAPEILCLIHSEISEALEEYRDGRDPREIRYSDEGKPEGFGIELADAVIRIADLCGYYGIDLSRLLQIKMEYNEGRPMRHGGKLA